MDGHDRYSLDPRVKEHRDTLAGAGKDLEDTAAVGRRDARLGPALCEQGLNIKEHLLPCSVIASPVLAPCAHGSVASCCQVFCHVLIKYDLTQVYLDEK